MGLCTPRAWCIRCMSVWTRDWPHTPNDLGIPTQWQHFVSVSHCHSALKGFFLGLLHDIFVIFAISQLPGRSISVIPPPFHLCLNLIAPHRQGESIIQQLDGHGKHWLQTFQQRAGGRARAFILDTFLELEGGGLGGLLEGSSWVGCSSTRYAKCACQVPSSPQDTIDFTPCVDTLEHESTPTSCMAGQRGHGLYPLQPRVMVINQMGRNNVCPGQTESLGIEPII